METSSANENITLGEDLGVFRWYAVQVLNGQENKVKALIEGSILANKEVAAGRGIRQVAVPVKTQIEERRGKRVEVETKIFPGYVLVEMVLNDESQHIIGGLANNGRFMGQGMKPQALRPEEVNRLLGNSEEEGGMAAEADRKAEKYVAGQKVNILDGPFVNCQGIIEKVMADKKKVKVSVSIFGRETLVEMECSQLAS